VSVATRWFSLRHRLLALLLGGVTLGWLASLALSYRDAHRQIDQLADAQLVQAAQTLLALAGEYDDDDDIADLEEHTERAHRYQQHLSFQIWDGEGRLVLRSRRAPETPLSDTKGFSDQSGWRYYSQWDREQHLRVVVGENHHAREELARHIVSRLLAPALVGLPLLGLWVWFATRRGLAPLAGVADEVARRTPDRLDPVVPATAPREIRPLVDSLNTLLARVERALEDERRFTADAAHELRTPLAALVTQAQVALRARDKGELNQAIEQILAGAQRAGRLIDQLLTLARLDPSLGIDKSSVRLDLLAQDTCADLGSAALAKEIALTLDAPDPIVTQGNADLLRVLLRNLLDNAVRYTPEGGEIQVSVSTSTQGIVLRILDSGPGIPAAQRTNALRRFHRLAGQDTEGSGLGLSIAARIAELHDARLIFTDGLGGQGLGVELSFQAA
jgi:two-component system, OmpR family, sensor histidine kinase QseC